ncbi:NAD(+) synthase [Candidatus Woesearchaeota archaeon]|nr:NAD(+) synthase [Candidatus Woesearchaeota archaeon]
MKIALAQMEVVSGRPKKNLETMLRMIEEAKEQHVNLIAFPELCISGYLVGDKWTEDAFCDSMFEFNDDIRNASEGIAVAYGNVFIDHMINQRVGDTKFHPNKDGRTRKYNAVYIFQNGKPAARVGENHPTSLLPPGVQPKTLLPNYRFFDDERYFFSLEDIAKDFGTTMEALAQPYLIDVQGMKVPVGFEVCEDLWCEDYRRNGESQNMTKMLIDNGARHIISISASPWTYGKNDARDRRIKFLKQDSKDKFVPFFYVNCAGAQNNGKNIVTFDGGSTIYNADGEPIVLSKEPYQEELILVDDAELTKPAVGRISKSLIAEKYEAIITGIRHLKNIQGSDHQPKYVIGLSGGVDSSVVAALLVQAVGAEKVLGVNMPTKFNSDKTRQAAASLAQQLGITYLEIPIGDMAALHEQALEGYNVAGAKKQLTASQKGNIAAKIRGTSILSNLAAQYGALFTNNGNKLEVALGYATLYGDVNGALAPIADLTKPEIFELATFLNTEIYGREVIPDILIPDALFRFGKDQIIPSAELEENQIDPMKFGYHDALLAMMTDYKKKSAGDLMNSFLQGTLHCDIAQSLGKEAAYGYELMKRWNVDEPKTFFDDLEWFARTINGAVFKRVQAPPIIITGKSAYGYDIRESLLPFEPTREEGRLREKIMGMERYLPRGDA